MGWLTVNKLRLNPWKTEVLLVGPDSILEGGISPMPDGNHSPLEGSNG